MCSWLGLTSLLMSLYFMGNKTFSLVCFLGLLCFLLLSEKLGDILYCSNAFKTFFYPVFEEMVVNQQHTSASKQFTLDGHVENFKRSLDLETRTRSDRFVISLQKKLDSLILILTKQFSVEETEVKTVSYSYQLQLFLAFILVF